MMIFRYDPYKRQLDYLQEEEHIIRDRVLTALTFLKDQYACQGWQGVIEPADGVQYVLDNYMLCDVDGTLVAFTVGVPWFLTKTIIGEEFIAGPAKLEYVVEALSALAPEFGAVRIEVGTRAAAGGRHQALARKYERLGFSVSTLVLTQEIST